MAESHAPSEYGCAACFGPDPEKAWSHKLETRCELIDESHFGVSLCQCPACRQTFVRLFTEFVDWTDGDDSQYWDQLPLTPAEADALAAQGASADLRQIEALGRDRRRLKADWPKGKPRRLSWATGGLSITPGY